HHAHDGERNALYPELAPDDVLGAGETLPPETMADDSDRAVRPSTHARGVLSCAEGRRGAAVVGRREHPAADTGNAEHVEQPAADERAIDRFRLTAGRQVEPLG